MKRLHELTHLQRQFAEEHQDTVFRFLSHKGLPVEDYYDIVIFGYLRLRSVSIPIQGTV